MAKSNPIKVVNWHKYNIQKIYRILSKCNAIFFIMAARNFTGLLHLQCYWASFQPPQFEEKENIRSSSGTTTNYSSNEKRINIVSG